MSSYAHVVHTTVKLVMSRRRKNENVYKMSKVEICTCKACKNTVFRCQICKCFGFLLPLSPWLLKLLIRELKLWERERQRQRHKWRIWLVEWRTMSVLHVQHAFYDKSCKTTAWNYHIWVSDDNRSRRWHNVEWILYMSYISTGQTSLLQVQWEFYIRTWLSFVYTVNYFYVFPVLQHMQHKDHVPM